MSQPVISSLKYGGASGSHWEGCETQHWDCRIISLQADLARLRARNEHLEATLRTVLSWTLARDVREYLEHNLSASGREEGPQ